MKLLELVLDLAGAGCLIAAAFTIATWIGLAVTGLALLFLADRLGRSGQRRTPARKAAP